MVKPENCPVITIACKRLTHAIDLKHLLSGYDRITYEIFTLEETFKYGESADEPDGERVYRQIWQFPGWPTQPSPNAAGRDIQGIVDQRPWINKDDLSVRIWDLRNIPAQNPYDPHKETRDIEQELIRRHIDQHGRAPIGNKVEQRRLSKGAIPTRHKATVAPNLLTNLFTEE